jgi:predicted amidohydrolase
MQDNILITGGHVIDPARGLNEKGDIYLVGDKIVPTEMAKVTPPDKIIKADGCLVMPGLIDFHSHLFLGGTDIGIPADVGLLPNCVTTAVDGGSAGTANFESFYSNIITNSLVRIKSFLNVSPTGISTAKYYENCDPQHYDEKKIELLFKKYPDILLGLKIRQSQEIVGELGLAPFQQTVQIAERLSCKVAVHTTNSPGDIEDLLALFRPGDIFVHVYHGTGNTIIGKDNRVLPAVKTARERGIIFDAANGKYHFAFKTAEAALKDGFAPDVVSSDITWLTMYKDPSCGLLWLMSKYLALGMDLYDIVAACTSTPARLMGMVGEIGTLEPDSCADIAILKLIDHPCEFSDSLGFSRWGQKLLMPQATIRAGRVVFRQLNF